MPLMPAPAPLLFSGKSNRDRSERIGLRTQNGWVFGCSGGCGLQRQTVVPMGSDRLERYLAHLDRLAPGHEPRFLPIEPSNPALKGVIAVT